MSIVAAQLAIAAPLPALYGPMLTAHVGSAGTGWRTGGRRATGSRRFAWTLDVERRHMNAQVGALALDYVRQRKHVGGDADPRPALRSLWMIGAAYRVAAPGGSPLLVQAVIGGDRRSSLGPSSRGRSLRTFTQDYGVSWQVRDNLSIDGGWHDQSSGGNRGLLDRAVDIGSGASLSEAGPHLGLALSGGGKALAGSGWRLGMDAGSYRLARHDAMALGAPPASDQRVNVSLRLGFR